MNNRLELWINGTDIRTLGGVAAEIPPIETPAKRILRYQVPGRSGELTRWLGDYETTIKLVEILCGRADVERIRRLLNSATSLRASNETDRVYDVAPLDKAVVTSLNPYERLIRASFLAQPYKRALTETAQTGKSLSIANPGGAVAFPKIKVNGSGTWTLTVNGKTWTLTSVVTSITLDSWLKQVTSPAGNAWGKLNRSDLPEIGEGQNIAISTTATSLEITPQWRWI